MAYARRQSSDRTAPSPTTTEDYEGNEVDVGVGDPAFEQGLGATAPESPDSFAIDLLVQTHATYGNKLSLEGSGAPTEDQLYTEVEEGGQAVTTQVGTLDKPFELYQGDPESLFIADYPWSQDVAQGGIGDCYLMAALLTASTQSAGLILDLLDDQGDSVTVNFKRWDKASKTWLPAPITTTKSTLVTLDEDGFVQDLHGAQHRVATVPKQSDWYADVTEDSLSINADRTFDMALWVPVIELAYAEYAQTYGQYGGFRPKWANDSVDEDGEDLSGIDIIEGGYEHLVLMSLFGDAVVDRFQTELDPITPGSTSLSSAHLTLVERLLQLDGQGLEDDETLLLHASGSEWTTVNNLLAYLPAVEAHFQASEGTGAWLGRTTGVGALGAWMLGEHDEDGALPSTWYLDALRKACEAWMATEDEDESADLINEISLYCARLIDPDTVPELHQDDTSSELTAFLEVAAQGATSGTDHSDGQRFVYTGHAYAVYGATFRNAEGQDVALTLDDLASQIDQVDTTQSTVEMGNPHHGNEVDLHNEGPDDGQDDGAFKMTLDQFLRGFDSIQGGVVET